MTKWGLHSDPDLSAMNNVLRRAAKDCRRYGFCGIAIVLVRAGDGGVCAAMAGVPEAEQRLREDAVEVLRNLIDGIGTEGVREGTLGPEGDA